jgi:ABC-type lipoprotein export system ATPase subunit
MIELQNIFKTYKVGDQSVHALKNISLSIEKGEFLVIVGPSGSGKSTLLHLIGGLDKPSSGTIKIDGKAVENLKDKEISKFRNEKIGYIFQDFKLHPHLNISENVKVPLVFNKSKKYKRGTIDRKAASALKEVGLEERANHKPDEISGGQKQRVAIARSLVNSPAILLADEPMGDLDSITGEKIIKLLKDFHKKKKVTMVVVTHDMSIAKFATRTVEIKDGKLVTKNKFGKFLTSVTDR